MRFLCAHLVNLHLRFVNLQQSSYHQRRQTDILSPHLPHPTNHICHTPPIRPHHPSNDCNIYLRHQSEQEAMQQTLKTLFAQDYANQNEQLKDAVVLCMAMAYLGTPGQFQKLRTYLTQANLPLIPMAHSAWAYLWSWNFNTIDRADVNPNGEPQIGRRSLDAAGTLDTSPLEWTTYLMSSMSTQKLNFCGQRLNEGLGSMVDQFQKKFPLLTNCFGFLNGLNLPVLVSDDEDVQNAYYNGWTCSHYCSCILAFAPDGTIMPAILNAPGLWHNSTIAEPLYDQLLHHTPPGYLVISNTAFPRKSARLQSRILAPVKRGD
ncbi:uncharacterized protein PGTG_12606 [Puccinia graminis f. sp. tritici CRL 75-36-700-3]|uniref:DDE Tnp4 domain-containing protein n=1 Tax=Puccinia graminis f. sp. tritici (strain CRL 75-36-700-3 / race SCCL) TaxID=418459 RepID=E3KUU9_PUCGT|nr:uncharacterized protein PGTG_12606 [Puccinia graminis f. sp. tritici CRL 75-36-700-3]EFP88159.2 hypothetical protein PGTG_12606 [Puccinia graminis f. sp. tritici CRL 75-36-700-3]